MKKHLLAATLASATLLTANAYDGNKSEWMKHIPGSTFACQVTIPGSHDSATGEGWATGSTSGKTYSQAQDVSIDDQLAQGARGFDVRPNKSGANWVCAHGIHNTTLSLAGCFDKFVNFLNANPSEFIVIHLYHGGSSWSDTNKAEFPQFLAGYSDYLINFRRDLTVDEMRGKILIFSREDYNGDIYGAMFKEEMLNDTGWGSWIDWTRQTNITATGNIENNLNQGRVFYQDLAETHKDGAMDEKLAGIRRLLDFSTRYRPAGPENCIWYFNFASAYSKVGIFNTSQSDGYRDNATHTNPEFINYLKDNPGPAGVVLADYICTDKSGNYETRGAELIDVLIDNNFRYLEYVENGVGTPAGFNPSASASNAVTWAFNDASKKFHGTQRSSAVMGDFSGNGRLDIISGGGNDHAKLLLNNGNWDVVDLHNQENGVVQNNFPHYCALDFNNDGKLDLLVCGVSDHDSNYASHGVPYIKISSGYAMTALYQNMGDNTFRLVENTGLPVIAAEKGQDNTGNSSQPVPFAVGDFDHDGYTDIAMIGRISDGSGEKPFTAVYRNNGDGTFTQFATFKPIVGNVHFADINNDGWLDLVFDGIQNDALDPLYSGGSNGCIYLNNNGESFDNVTSQEVRFYSTRNGGSALADFNKDGYLDLFTLGYGDHGLGFAALLYYNNKGGNGNDGHIFITPDKLNNHYGLSIDWAENHRISVRDVNGDGNLDIIYDGSQDNTVHYGSEAMMFRRADPIGCRGGGGDDAASAFGDVTGNGLVDRYQTGYQWFDDEMTSKRHGGTGNGWNWEASLYENKGTAQIAELAAPTGVRAAVTGEVIEVNWTDIDDITAAYNVVIWNETNGAVIANIPVNPATSTLSVADGKETAIRPGIGTYTVKMPALKSRDAASVYKVGVQALSLYTEKSSPIVWADRSTGVEDAALTNVPAVKVVVEGDNVIVRAADDCDVKVIDMLGRTVATGVANTPISVVSNGVFIVKTPTTTVKISK